MVGFAGAGCYTDMVAINLLCIAGDGDRSVSGGIITPMRKLFLSLKSQTCSEALAVSISDVILISGRWELKVRWV